MGTGLLVFITTFSARGKQPHGAPESPSAHSAAWALPSCSYIGERSAYLMSPPFMMVITRQRSVLVSKA